MHTNQLQVVAQRLKTFSAEQAVSLALKILASTSDETLIKLSYFLEAIAKSPTKKHTIKTIREAFASGHPSIKLSRRLLKELHPNCKRGIINYIVQAIAADSSSRKLYQENYGVAPPIVALISPTMRCNLKCIGCYAAEYEHVQDMKPETFNRLLQECKEIGVHLVTILGGEPFIYKPLLEVLGSHKDMVFQVFTNGTLITEALAAKIVALGNLAPVFSLEGFKSLTDARRGNGIFQRTVKAMEIMRQAGGLFLFSVTVTPQNYKEVVSDEFIDLMIEKGAALGWYFNYMPVGRQASLKLMPTPEQRNYVRAKVTELRRQKPILLVDFWGDGPLVGGCLAGGKLYFHITTNGDVEPCIFAHFAVDNINNKSLVEVLNSNFFKAIRRAQPFGHNEIRPCPMIDHPGAMQKLVQKYGAKPTHFGADKIIGEFIPELKVYAQEVARLYNPIWEQEYQWAHKNKTC